MISNKIDEMKELLEVLKLIKCENDVTETKILLKMCKQREDYIRQYIDGRREDLANAEKQSLK